MKKYFKIILALVVFFNSFPSYSSNIELDFTNDEPIVITNGDNSLQDYEDGNCYGGGCGESNSDFDSANNGHSGNPNYNEGHRNWDRLSDKEKEAILERRFIQEQNVILSNNLSNSEYELNQLNNNTKISFGKIEIKPDSSSTEQIIDTYLNDDLSGNSYLYNNYLSSYQHDFHYFYKSEKKDQLFKIKVKLTEKQPTTPQQVYAQAMGLSALVKSDQAYLASEKESGDFYLEVALKMADIVTDFIPATSIPKDLYKAFVGKDFVTGENLSNTEKLISGGFAVLAMGTLGSSNIFKTALNEIKKLTKASSLEYEISKKLLDVIPKNSIITIKSVEEANQFWMTKKGYTMAPYRPGTVVIEITLLEDFNLFRAYSESNLHIGNWFTHITPSSMTKDEFRQLYSLTPEMNNTLSFYRGATIKKGSTIRCGITNPLQEYKGGGIQWDLMGQKNIIEKWGEEILWK